MAKLFTIWKRFHFEAAHFLPNVPTGHKCAAIHGHHFTVTIYVSGTVDAQGWVLDYSLIKGAFLGWLEKFDHHLLNEIPGLENPTSENLALFVLERLTQSLPSLVGVSVQEGEDVGAEIWV